MPGSTSARVNQIILCNTDSVARTVTLYFGANTVANTFLAAESLAAGESRYLTLNVYLAAAATIQGFASTAAVVSCQAFGVEES